MKFHTVIIIYNPNSTGSSQSDASSLKSKLTASGYTGDITLIGTKFAGHAEEIAADYAMSEGTLIVSASGDGGYNEVVNAIRSSDGQASVAVLPSGNANDHATALHSDNFVQHIASANTKNIDIIKVTSTVDGKPWTRYAHSYVGFGMTPSIGRLLTDKRPGALLEKWYVFSHLFSFKHVSLRSDGKKQRYTNLVVATIPKMSKVVRLDEEASVTDGKVEVYSTKYVSRLKMFISLLGIGISGIASERSVDTITVQTIRPTLLQLDGEVVKLDGNVNVRVECDVRSLKTVV